MADTPDPKRPESCATGHDWQFRWIGSSWEETGWECSRCRRCVWEEKAFPPSPDENGVPPYGELRKREAR